MTTTISERRRANTEPVKGSRFIATASPVTDEAAARSLLADINAEMPDASHHCWAWRIASPLVERAGDDGEPGGSAGRPILAQITGRDLVNVAVVVSRWFGGTKLGVGGLVRAYGAAAALVLDECTVERYVPMCLVALRYEYGDIDLVQRLLRQAGAIDISVDYDADVAHRLELPADLVSAVSEALANSTSGRVRIDSDRLGGAQ